MTKLLTPDEVADYLGVPLNTLKYWRYLNDGPDYIKVGYRVRYRESAVEAWLAKRTETAA